MTRITIYSGPSIRDDRPPGVSVRYCSDREVTEELRKIGLEWKTADYMGGRQVVITLDPEDDSEDKQPSDPRCPTCIDVGAAYCDMCAEDVFQAVQAARLDRGQQHG